MVNVVHTLSLVLSIIITLSLTMPYLSRLWRLMINQSSDTLGHNCLSHLSLVNLHLYLANWLFGGFILVASFFDTFTL